MRAEDRASFTDFVSAEQAALLRLAVLLTGDRGSAEDLAQTALTACYRHWPRVLRDGAPGAYARRALVTAHLSWWRRLSSPEQVIDDLPDSALAWDEPPDDDAELRRALRDLPPRARTAVVLRYHEDLSEQRTAELVGAAAGAAGPTPAHLEVPELRTRLEALAYRTAPPPRDAGELTATVAAPLAQRRWRLGTVAALAVVVAALLLVVPGVGSSPDRGPGPAPPEESVDVYGAPARGALSDDSAFADGVRAIPWAVSPEDRRRAPRVADRRVVWADDLGSLRAALVAGPDPAAGAGAGQIGLAWFTGSTDDGPAGMRLAAVRYGVDPSSPAALVDTASGVVVVVGAPSDQVAVSLRPEVDADGTIRRIFRPVATVDGVASLVEDYVVADEYGSRDPATALRYRVLRGGDPVPGPTDVHLDPDVPPPPELTADRLRPAPPAHPGDAAATLAMRDVLTLTGLAPEQVSFTVLWAGDLHGPRAGTARLTIVAARFPSGAQYVAGALGTGDLGERSSCGSEVRPAGTPLDRPLVLHCAMQGVRGPLDSLVIAAPRRAPTAESLDAVGNVLDGYRLTDGVVVVPWNPRIAAVTVHDAGGRPFETLTPLDTVDLGD